MSGCYLGLDIGGTRSRVVLSRTGKLDETCAFDEFPSPASPDELIARLRSWLDGQRGTEVAAVGLAVAGVVDDGGQRLSRSPNLPGWEGYPLSSKVAEATGARAAMANDAEAAAHAEAVHGRLGRQRCSGWVLVWGTGFGGSFVRFHPGGYSTEASEPGHQVIVDDGERCVCGQRGCLEAYVGGSGIQRRFGCRPNRLSSSAWDATVGLLGQGVSNLVLIRPTRLVVFGGGVAIRQPTRVAQIGAQVSARLRVLETPVVCTSDFGDRLGLAGALVLATRSQPQVE